MASSFVALSAPPAAASPSIVLLGTPAAAPIEARPSAPQGRTRAVADAPAIFVISPSVVAYGADAIPKASEAVASIGSRQPAEAGWRSAAVPLVIRGGSAGGGTPPATASAPQVEAAAGQGEAPPSSRSREPQPAAAPQAPAQSSPPTLQPK